MIKAIFEDTQADLSEWTFEGVDEAFSSDNLRPMLRAIVLDAFDGDGLGKSDYGKEADELIDKFRQSLLTEIASTIDWQIKEDTTIRLWRSGDGQPPEIGVEIPLAGADGLFCSLPLSSLVDDFLDPLSLSSGDAKSCSDFASAFRGFADKFEAAATRMLERKRDT